jgi:hypothetical protein
MSVIRNTNTKIILRLPDESDRELVGKAAGLNDDQIVELARLQCGVAAVYQNDWIQPVLCRVDHVKEPDVSYKFDVSNVYQTFTDDSEIISLKKRITFFLLSNMIQDPPSENIDSLRESVLRSNISARIKAKIIDCIYLGDNPPRSIENISDVVAGLYNYSGSAIEKLNIIGVNNIDCAWAKMLFDEVTLRIADFTEQVQIKIMDCIIREISYQNDTLRDLCKKWDELGRGHNGRKICKSG